MAGATVGFVFTDRLGVFILLRLVQGVGRAMTIPASMALVAAVTEKQTRGSSMGLYSTILMVGLGIGPLIGGVLQAHFGFHFTLYVSAALTFLSILLLQMWIDEPPNETSIETTSRFQIFDTELLTAGVIALGIAMFLMANTFSMITALENEFNVRLQQTAIGFSVAFSALTLTRFLIQVPLGWISDRVGRKPLIIVGLILLAPATALLGWVGTTFQLVGIRAVQGIASAAIATPALALAADLSAVGSEGRQLGIVTMGYGLGIALGPLAAGILATFFFELPFLVGGLISLVGAGFVYRYTSDTIEYESVTLSS